MSNMVNLGEYRIGDKILIDKLTSSVYGPKDSDFICSQKVENCIGEITNIVNDKSDGCDYYTILVSESFGYIVVGSHILKKYPRIFYPE